MASAAEGGLADRKPLPMEVGSVENQTAPPTKRIEDLENMVVEGAVLCNRVSVTTVLQLRKSDGSLSKLSLESEESETWQRVNMNVGQL